MKFIGFLFLSVLFFVNPIHAQKYYTWDEYSLKFTVGDNFEETQNDAEGFVAAGDGISLSIIPFKDATVDRALIKAYTEEIAGSRHLENIERGQVTDLNYFKGTYVEGVEDGVRIFLMGLLDPNSDNNFFIILAFPDGDKAKLDEATEIIRSIEQKI